MKGLVLLLSLVVLPFTHAATLTGNNGVQIVAIDGSKHKSAFLNKKIADLSEGKHQVVVEWEDSFKSNGLVSSKPHIFDIEITGDTVISVKNFNTQSQAEQAIRKGLTWIINDPQTTYEIVGSDTLSGEGLFPYGDIEKLIVEYNQQQGISLAPVATSSVLVSSTSLDLISATQQQLIDVYNSATKDQQKAFRIWLIEQDMK